MFRSLTPERFESVALTAVLTLNPSTTRRALFSSVGYPSVEISYLVSTGALIR